MSGLHRRAWLWFGVTLALVATSARAEDRSGPAFDAVKAEVQSFRHDAKRRQFRHHYTRYMRAMSKVHKRYPNGERGDDALYVVAQLADELSLASQLKADRVSAVDAYLRVAERYPTSNLADDALYHAARLRMDRLNDVDGARALLERIVAMPNADFAPNARRLLERLPNVVELQPAPAEADPDPKPAAAPRSESVQSAGERVPAAEPKPLQDRVTAALARLNAEPIEGGHVAPPAGKTVELRSAPSRKTRRSLKRIRVRGKRGAQHIELKTGGPVGVARGELPASGDTPRRVFFDVYPARLLRGAKKPQSVSHPAVTRVRAGQNAADRARIVFEMKPGGDISLGVRKKPFTLVFRPMLTASEAPQPVAVQPAPAPTHPSGDVPVAQRDQTGKAPPDVSPETPPQNREPGAQAQAVQKPTPTQQNTAKPEERTAESKSTAASKSAAKPGAKKGYAGLRRIVIDPGHGGKDSGAVGKHGGKEKEVVLAIAKKLRDRLKKSMPGVEVILTRDTDVFIELSDRTRIANDAEADLFVSIHANASVNRRVYGTETYYLNIAHDRYGKRLAARENAMTESAISDLEFILADLAMKSNVRESIQLGKAVQSHVITRLRKDYKHVKDLGLKHALFYVLIGARMPAILVETSFISNRREEKRLKSAAYQDAIAEGIERGIQRFADERAALAP